MHRLQHQLKILFYVFLLNQCTAFIMDNPTLGARSHYSYPLLMKPLAVHSPRKRVSRCICDGYHDQASRRIPRQRESYLSSLSESSKSSEARSNKINQVKNFVDQNFFLIGMLLAVAFARMFPALGKNGGILRPELIIGKYAVGMIFLLSGLSLELSKLTNAMVRWKLNGMIQTVIFLLWPLFIGVPLVQILGILAPATFPKALRDGILILSCLPTTVNMNVILTSGAGGNVAAALCNAVISNLGGILVTPALLFHFFGSHIQLPFVEMLGKLANKVLLPVAVGQLLRTTRAKGFYQKRSSFFKRFQEVILISILWNAFCTAISESLGLNLRSGLGLLALLPLVHLVALGGVYTIFSLPLWKFSRHDIVAAIFCASQKTLAFGLPLIHTIFNGNPSLAAYCAPIMFIHPVQLMIGSILMPRLQSYTQGEKAGQRDMD